MNTIPATKELKIQVNFLNAAASDDYTRPILGTICVSDDLAVACDGFRLHAVKPEGLDEAEGLNEITVNKDVLILAEMEDATYPDVSQIIPAGEPEYSFLINPEFLTDALKHFEKDSTVMLRFFSYDRPMEIVGHLPGDIPAYALIMPRWSESTEYWHPTHKIVVFSPKKDTKNEDQTRN